jgi:hypothetical protein
MSRRYYAPPLCVDCSVDTIDCSNYYIVWDDLWASARMTPQGGMLCIPCLETRIGRELTPDDFETDVPLNDDHDWFNPDRIEFARHMAWAHKPPKSRQLRLF